jgi:hypothetical protein
MRVTGKGALSKAVKPKKGKSVWEKAQDTY